MSRKVKSQLGFKQLSPPVMECKQGQSGRIGLLAWLVGLMNRSPGPHLVDEAVSGRFVLGH